jgi:transcription elongation GreA/GreB family factor
MVAGRRPTVEILYWLARRLDLAAAWNTGRPADMPFLILDALSLNYSGESLKAANQLRALFQQQEWLQPVVSAMSREQREDLMRRLNQPLGGVGVDSRAVMARMIRMYPELNATLASEETRASDDGPSPRGGYTSWRSHRARQAQYQKLVNEDIPGNSREIALARSYGDLSENYEYKAAKEHQRLLLQRQAELEQDLQSIRGTDFSEFPTDIAGMGTSVTLRHEDGHTQDLFILGEWDQDEPLGIISCRSRLGLILAGRRAGDGVTIPTGHGEAPCTVVKVAGLPDSIRKWVRGE